ncbi:MAG: glycosyltransferase family 2 protein [Candidatus Daviesbacteria bacterium]|nr:glycosyltransferase family 2 protein [Candidatus Daviesbacteria bacterium]
MKISILVPCHNEEKSIKRCLLSCLNQSKKADQIVVVNDGSTDKSLEILKKFKEKITIVNIPVHTTRKSLAQAQGIKKINGDLLITTDADTILDRDFIKNIIEDFDDPKVVASAGYVKSIQDNWLTACRQIDYLIGQEIHRKAQSNINALYVIPGCAAAYRTKIFKKLILFDHDTLAEDLDFTYKYHEQNLKISYNKKAIVYTEDPANLYDYVRQLRRWNAGNWQNLLKHYRVLDKPSHALEHSLTYFEGLIFPLLILISLFINIKAFLIFYLFNFIIVFGFAIFGAIRDKRLDLFVVAPIYLFITLIHYFVFIEQFIFEILLRKNNLIWFKPERKAWI